MAPTPNRLCILVLLKYRNLTIGEDVITLIVGDQSLLSMFVYKQTSTRRMSQQSSSHIFSKTLYSSQIAEQFSNIRNSKALLKIRNSFIAYTDGSRVENRRLVNQHLGKGTRQVVATFFALGELRYCRQALYFGSLRQPQKHDLCCLSLLQHPAVGAAGDVMAGRHGLRSMRLHVTAVDTCALQRANASTTSRTTTQGHAFCITRLHLQNLTGERE